MANEMNGADRFEAIENRVDRLDAKIDARFEQVDRRFEQVDQRFEQVDRRFEQVDRRFDEQHSYFKTLHEASRSDFNNLYDFVKARTDSLDMRFDRLQAEMNSRFADVQAAIVGLAEQLRRRTRRPRR